MVAHVAGLVLPQAACRLPTAARLPGCRFLPVATPYSQRLAQLFDRLQLRPGKLFAPAGWRDACAWVACQRCWHPGSACCAATPPLRCRPEDGPAAAAAGAAGDWVPRAGGEAPHWLWGPSRRCSLAPAAATGQGAQLAWRAAAVGLLAATRPHTLLQQHIAFPHPEGRRRWRSCSAWWMWSTRGRWGAPSWPPRSWTGRRSRFAR